MKCKRCASTISLKQVFRWVSSGTDHIQCTGCNRKLGHAGHLFFIYLVAGVFGLLVAGNGDGFAEDLPFMGIESVFVLSLLILTVLLPLWLYLVGFLTVYMNNHLSD